MRVDSYRPLNSSKWFCSCNPMPPFGNSCQKGPFRARFVSLSISNRVQKSSTFTAAKLLVLQHSPRLLFSPICFVQVDKLLRSLASLADEIKDDLAFLQSIKAHGKERSKGGKKNRSKGNTNQLPFLQGPLVALFQCYSC